MSIRLNEPVTLLQEGIVEKYELKCRNCNHVNAVDLYFCSMCGAPLRERICPKCLAKNDSSHKFCRMCGIKFSK